MNIDNLFTLGEKDRYGVQMYKCNECRGSFYKMGRQSHFAMHRRRSKNYRHGEEKNKMDIFKDLNEAYKQGGRLGLREYFQQTGSHQDYTEWLEDRVVLLTEQIITSLDTKESTAHLVAMQQLLKSIGAQKKFANDQMVRCSINGDAKGQEAWHGYGQALTWVISSIETQDTAEGLQNIVDVG